MTRLPFIIADLERAMRVLAPNGPAPEIVLGSGTFRPVVDELASHYGVPLAPDAREYRVGDVLIRSGG